MINFFNALDNYIIILGEDLEVKFCNDKFLEDVNINQSEINKIIIDSSSEENILNIAKHTKETEMILELFIENMYIRINSKLIKEIYKNEECIYIVGKDLEKTYFKAEKNIIEENVKESFQVMENVIGELKYIYEKLENKEELSDINKSVDIKNVIDKAINEIYKNELIRKDFEVFLNISADLLGGSDTKGNLIILDESWTKCLGWETEELIHNNIIDLIHASQKEEFKDLIDTVNTETKIIENKIKCKDGSYKWLRWNIKLIKETNMIAFTMRDITATKEEEKLRKKLEEEVQLETIKNQFFANMSHEFRTPLNIILGTVQLLDSNIEKGNIICKNNANIDNYVRLIKQNSYRLLRLISNLIDITKIDTGYYSLELENYNIVNIVEEISLSVAEYASDKDISLIFDTDCEEVIIACDPEKIERILLNLLSNAIKNTPEKGNILVKVKSNENEITVSVSDNGNGIPNDKLPFIFNRFVQVDNTLSRGYEGSGIGLSLVKSLVNMHGGEITVDSELGVGTEFNFTLVKMLNDYGNNKIDKYNEANHRIEKCNIEFSDIYN